MSFWRKTVAVVVIIATLGCGFAIAEKKWGVHDPQRPAPEVVKPATCSTQDKPGQAPGDAIVLFDGSDLSQWASKKDGSGAKWTVQDGYMEVKPGAGDIVTKQKFGDCQLHIEWASPENDNGSGQGKGNSGVFLMDTYEVQVLDCYNNKTYADGSAAAIYGQSPPAVNVCRKPGEWQTYDIIFNAPEFSGDKVIEPATVTVLHNGVLVQDHWVIKGTTLWKKEPYYQPHADKLPIRLQDHSDRVRFRNIWIRPLN